MKRALLLVRTPFQAYLAEQVLREESINTYDLIYFTHHDSPEDQYYYNHLGDHALLKRYCYAPSRRHDIFSHLDWLWQSRASVRGLTYDTLLLASIDSYVLATITSKQEIAELVTFDDGVANYIRTSRYNQDRSTWRNRLYRALLHTPPIDEVKRRIKRHYTLHPQLDNIVSPNLLRRLPTPASWMEVGRASMPPKRFFIGQPFREALTVAQILKLRDWATSLKLDYYVQHPRETRPLDLGVPLLDKGEKIAEDAIFQASRGNSVQLFGWLSGVMLNMGDRVERTVMLFREQSDWSEMAELADKAGCKIVAS